MAKRSHKNNRKRGSVKVRRHTKKDRLKKGLSTSAIAAKWDRTLPIGLNYARNGYVDSMNSVAKIQESKYARLNPSLEFVDMSDVDIPNLKDALKAASGKNVKQKTMSSDEKTYLNSLTAKHGDDYKAMEKDIKLNSQQKSAQRLKTRIGLLSKGKKATQGKSGSGGDDVEIDT